MKTNKLWAIGLSGLLMTAGIPSQIAMALSATEVSTKAKAFTMQIDGDGGVGSGVLFDRQGDTYYVLTNRHVVSQDGRYEIQTPDGDRYPVYYSQALPGMDLAILQFNSKKTYTLAQLGNSDQIKEGSSVYVVGWAGSLPGINERSYQITDGRIRSLLSKPDDGYAMVYNNEAIPGMSGGPVLNEDGLVVGINGRATPPEEKTGTVLRLGIPINSFVAARKNLPADGGQQTPVASNPERIETATTPPRVNDNKAPTAEQFVSLGGSKSSKKDYQGAIEAYSRALEIDKNNPDAYFGRGVARSQIQDFKGAIDDFSQVIRLTPKNAFAYGYRGLIKVYLQDYKGALADSDKAISLEPKAPNSAPAYGVRGMANIGLENYRGAVADFDQVIKQFPNQADFYALRGLSRGAAGDRAGVIPDVQKAADLYKKAGRTKDYENAQTIATSMQAIPSSVDTSSIFRVALKAALQSLTPGGGGGTTPTPTNNRTETTPPASQASAGNIDRTPPASQSPPGELKDAVAYFNRAVDNYKAGKKPEALADLNQAIRLNPKYSQAWYNRGLVLADLGQTDQALASYDRAIAANNQWVGSKLVDVYVSKGVLLSDRQEHKAAIAAFTQAIRLDSKNGSAYYGRGFSYYKLKDHRRAIDDYTASIKFNPELGDAYLSRGFARYERGDLTGAIADIRQALVTYKDSPGLHLALGMALYKQGKREEGLKFAEKAIDLDRRVTDLKFLKQNNWGDRLLADTDKLLKNPRLARKARTSGV